MQCCHCFVFRRSSQFLLPTDYLDCVVHESPCICDPTWKKDHLAENQMPHPLVKFDEKHDVWQTIL